MALARPARAPGHDTAREHAMITPFLHVLSPMVNVSRSIALSTQHLSAHLTGDESNREASDRDHVTACNGHALQVHSAFRTRPWC